MLDAQGRFILLNHARDLVRQHFAIDAGLDNMDYRPLGSDPKLVDDETRKHCRERMSACRERAHETLAGLIEGSKVTAWRETESGEMSVAAPEWARAAFDGRGGLRADRLYFATSDWEALLPQLTSAESRRYLFNQRNSSSWQSSAPRRATPTKEEFKTASSSDIEKDSDLAGLGEWCLCFQAVRRLHRRLKDAAGIDDPAPWIDTAEWHEDLRVKKWNARTGLTFRRALLAGELKAYFLGDSGEQLVPGWAWANERAAAEAMHVIALPIDPFLDYEAGSDMRAYIRRSELEAWLKQANIASAEGLPTLPDPYDIAAKPAPITYREPTETPFVDLTEAITWTAFRISMSRVAFRVGEYYQFGPFAAAGHIAVLEEAVSRFASAAAGGLIRVRGRYVESYFDEAAGQRANTTYLSDTQLRDFASYDLLDGGLVRGAGLGLKDDPLDHALHGRADGWRDVELCRADLLKLFPLSEVSDMPAQPSATSRKGRANGTGFQKADAALIEQMRQAIVHDPSLNATSAAKLFADQAKGASFEAKVDRLARAYRAGRNGG